MNLIISTELQEKQRIEYLDGKKIVSKYIGKKEIELLEEQKLAANVLEGSL